MLRKTSHILSIFFLFVSFSILACSGAKEQTSEGEGNGTSSGTTNKDSMVKATVKDRTHLDGCLYMLITEKGKKLNPLNLDSAYFEDGLKVRLRYRKKDAMTTCMAGQNIKVLEIEALE
ncbi:MAG: hypothetical protein ABEH38_07645 [Flavobacteriales bacterium]